MYGRILIGHRGMMGRAPSEGLREHHESLLRRLGLHRRRNTVLPPGIHEPVRVPGALETPDQPTPSVSELIMAHAGPLPPIWTSWTTPIEEFTELLNGWAPDALGRNSFALL